MVVVVAHILCQHRRQLPPAHDQHPVEQLTTDGTDPSFRERIRLGRPHRCAEDLDALGAEDHIEAVGELRVPVADEEPELPEVAGQLHQQVAGLLGCPCAGRVGRHPKEVDAAAGDLDDEQDVQAFEQHRVDVKEVACQHAVGLGGQEPPPSEIRTARRGIDADAFQQQPYGAWRDRVAKLGEFAVDPAIPPGRVLPSHPDDQTS
jgi:hypothetical protein